jgi:hypothetical protein
MSPDRQRSGVLARRRIGPPKRRFVAALVAGRCPQCRDARIFRGLWAMHAACPRCGLRFDREPGYFTGAMYVSYALALPLLALLVLAVRWFLPGSGIERSVALAAVLFLPAVPLVFRYSRILWIYLDRAIDPD